MEFKDQDLFTPRSSESLSNVLSQLGGLLLGVIPLLGLVYGFRASWFWIGLGSISWIVALLIKIPLAGITYLYFSSDRGKVNACVSGILSSVSELGVAAFLFNLYPPKNSVLVNIIAYGTAAGCTEILFALISMYLDKQPAETIAAWLNGARQSFCVRYVFFIERLVALTGHIGARGLISLSLYSGVYELAAIPLVSFALTDGLAAYGGSKKWNWFDPTTCRTFYGVCTSISLIEVMLFALLSSVML